MEYIAEIIIFLLTFLLVVTFLNRSAKYNLPPGPRPWPLIGNAPILARTKSMYRELLRLRDEYGDIFSIRLGHFQGVVLNGYDLIHEAFVINSDITAARPKQFLRLTQPSARVDPLGILIQDGHPLRSLRRFTLSTLRDLGFGKKTVEEKILDESAALNSEIVKRVDKEWDGSKMSLSMATSNVICHLIFGSRFEYKDTRFQDIMRTMREAFQIPRPFNMRTFLPFYQYLPEKLKILARRRITDVFTSIRSLVSEQIEEHKKTYDSDNIRDYVDMYLKVTAEGKESIDEEDMFGGIRDLFLAGTETSATTLSWALLYMMEFPDIQKRCQLEIDQVVGGNRQVRLDDKKNLPYTDATVHEVQRYSSTVAVVPFHRVTEDMWISGYQIPKDTMILANLYSALRDPRYWKDPDTFCPGHFLDESGNVKTNSAFMPFSAGPRVCLGESLAKMEIFLFFANMIQQFTFSKVSQQDQWLDKEVSSGSLRLPVQYRIKASLREG